MGPDPFITEGISNSKGKAKGLMNGAASIIKGQQLAKLTGDDGKERIKMVVNQQQQRINGR